MDSDATSIVAIVGLVLSIGGTILATVNHRRVRSNCCGLPLIVSVDVESTTPPLTIKIPDEQKRAQATPVETDA